MLKLFIFCCYFLLAGFLTYPQSRSIVNIDQVAGQFIKMVRSDSSEKVIAFTDKWFYQAGEEIWFRAYCLDALSNRPVHISKNLFVDIVNDKDSVISQMLMNISEGRTGGGILLPASLKEGYYWMRAYTTKTIREDSNGIFVKPIYILSERRPDPHALSATIAKSEDNLADSSLPQLVFLPEGGAIISGTTATVAFRAQSALGKPLDVSGYISDSRDSIVGSLNTSLPGIGKFSFDAWNRRKYIAHVKWINKRDLTFPLPAIDQFATQLSLLDQSDEAFHIRVSQGDSLYKKNKITYLLGVSRDSLCFAANGTDMYDVNIPKTTFPRGKATLYLFNDQGQIVSQRSLYIDSSSTKITAVPDKMNYGPREMVKLNIEFSSDNHPVNALVSVSVTDDRYAKAATKQNQISSLMTDGVELPEERSSTGHGQDKKYSQTEMDLIMLTGPALYPGWKYGKELKPLTPPVQSDDNNLLDISGKILSKANQPLSGYLVNLFSDQKGMFKLDTTDAKGHFQFSLPDYDDGTKFNLKLTNMEGKGEQGKVVLDNPNFPRISTPWQLKRKFNAAELVEIRTFRSHLLDTLSSAMGNSTLQPVTVQSGKSAGTSIDESKRVSKFSTIITHDKFQDGDPNALVNIIRQVPGLNRGLTMSAGGSATGVQPLIVVDGVAQSLPGDDDNSFLMSLDPSTLDFVEILKGAETAMYGMQGSGGVILINSSNKRGGSTQIDEKGLSTIYPKGYYKEANFLSPNYEKKDPKKTAEQDLRSTIYWKGNILMDASGKANIEFYTADEPTTYTVNLMGVTNTGEIVFKQIKLSRK